MEIIKKSLNQNSCRKNFHPIKMRLPSVVPKGEYNSFPDPHRSEPLCDYLTVLFFILV